MEKNNNRSSVSHTIRAPGYRYDIFKGELLNGSHIAKTKHPISEVEEFKRKLFVRKLLKDAGTYWILKKNLRTGHLMADNLHMGSLVEDTLYKQDIIVSSDEAIRLYGKLPEKNICVTDSKIVMKSICDTLRFSSINIMEVNKEFLTHQGSDTFGQDEAFVLKFLQERGVISPSARHGLATKKEADIVDEINGEQYEITYEFKTELSKKKMKSLFYSPEMLALQLADSPFIHTSRSLEKKMKKEYADRYRSNLVILTLGSKQSTTAMLEALCDDMQQKKILELNYSNVYVISLDFINERAIFVRISLTQPPVLESFPCKNDELGFIKLTPIEFSSIEDAQKYLMVCNGIFDNTQRIRYDDGKSLKAWAKNVRIWGI